jgi:hypothetical protein
VVEPYRGPVHRAAVLTLDGTDHQTHDEQASMIGRYVAWRNRNTDNPRLHRIVESANVA